jgi:hypothetical protein
MGTTLNAGITKPLSENDAQKVGTYNNAVDELDAAALGYGEKSVAGTGNVTLTRTEALHAVFKFTGTLTGNKVVLIPHTLGSSRLISVWNATTGAFTLTIKTTAAGSTGVAITQNKVKLLFHDNVNVYSAAAEVTP